MVSSRLRKETGHVAAARKRSHQWCLTLTPNNTETIERMIFHCFLRPIRSLPLKGNWGELKFAKTWRFLFCHRAKSTIKWFGLNAFVYCMHEFLIFSILMYCKLFYFKLSFFCKYAIQPLAAHVFIFINYLSIYPSKSFQLAPKPFFISRIDYNPSLSWISPKNCTFPSGKLGTEFTKYTPIAKSTSPGLSNTSFHERCGCNCGSRIFLRRVCTTKELPF